MVDEIRQALRSQQCDEQRERRQKLVDDRRGASVYTKELEPMPIEEFEAMLKDIKAQRNNKHYLRKVKNSLALGDDYISRFLRTNGALEQLLSVTLRSVESSCQLEALACFTNLACGDHKATFRVLRCAGPYLITFLNGSNPFLQEQSAWCLTNIAKDCDECRNLLRCQGASHAFIKALQSIYPQVIDMAVLALQAYAQSPPDIIQDLVTRGLLKHLLPLFDRDSAKPDFIGQLGWITFYAYSNDSVQVEDMDCTARLCHTVANKMIHYSLAPQENSAALASLLVCLATWSSRSCDLASALAGMAGMVAALGRLLEAPYLHLRREALWLMHCLSGPLAQYDLAEISAAINGIVPLLTPGAEYITEVLLLLQGISTALPAFRHSLAGSAAVLAQLQQMTPEHFGECQKLQAILSQP
ncbi:importin subunit alpha-6 isoform X1 [Rhipicephalus sanguineus]|uniref:importin subunit alpha-6 isoform X1 n=1 Tax=Rhipicephalus sanguineus TaxID=34632 RepID=UPI001895CA96|nr:importin subunit alpha-6 isoform X1 [Rhipicephalus sanguineus]